MYRFVEMWGATPPISRRRSGATSWFGKNYPIAVEASMALVGYRYDGLKLPES